MRRCLLEATEATEALARDDVVSTFLWLLPERICTATSKRNLRLMIRKANRAAGPSLPLQQTVSVLGLRLPVAFAGSSLKHPRPSVFLQGPRPLIGRWRPLINPKISRPSCPGISDDKERHAKAGQDFAGLRVWLARRALFDPEHRQTKPMM